MLFSVYYFWFIFSLFTVNSRLFLVLDLYFPYNFCLSMSTQRKKRGHSSFRTCAMFLFSTGILVATIVLFTNPASKPSFETEPINTITMQKHYNLIEVDVFYFCSGE